METRNRKDLDHRIDEPDPLFIVSHPVSRS